jgi:hypothetical protein
MDARHPAVLCDIISNYEQVGNNQKKKKKKKKKKKSAGKKKKKKETPKKEKERVPGDPVEHPLEPLFAREEIHRPRAVAFHQHRQRLANRLGVARAASVFFFFFFFFFFFPSLSTGQCCVPQKKENATKHRSTVTYRQPAQTTPIGRCRLQRKITHMPKKLRRRTSG